MKHPFSLINRSFDAEFINSVINDPSVKDAVEVVGDGDISALVNDVNNVLLVTDHGGFLFVHVQQGVYEVHTQMLESGRGIDAYSAAVECARYMFTLTNCMRIISKARPENKGARKLAAEVLNHKGFNGTYHYYSLEYMEWVETDEIVKVEGERFHDLVEGDTNHINDDTHDYHVGGALMLCKSNNALKAQQVYNYWAIASGYEMANINSLSPLIISIGNMRLLITDTVEVI